jgi:hypothetical protein
MFCTEIMVDAEDVFFREIVVEDAAERVRRFAVAPERFLHHEPRVLRAARLGELGRHLREQDRRNGEVVQGALGIAHLLAQTGEHVRVGVVAVHVAKLAQELLERIGVDVAAMGLDAVGRALFELVQSPALLGDADNRRGQALVTHEPVKSGEDLLIGEITGRAEEGEGVGIALACLGHGAFFSR